MRIGRICRREVDFAELSETAFQAAERMPQRTVGALIVLDAYHRPIGIVTDRNLTTRVIAGCRDPFATTVEEVMTHKPKTVSEKTAIESALSLMA